MKKAIQAAVIASLFTSVAAFAHHPAAFLGLSAAVVLALPLPSAGSGDPTPAAE